MPHHRRKPFSGKQKKQQLQERKARKANEQTTSELPSLEPIEFIAETSHSHPLKTDNAAPVLGKADRLGSVFEKLSPEKMERARLESMQPFHRLEQSALEVAVDLQSIDFPKRPSWDYAMSKEEVERQEEEAFQSWMQGVYDKYHSNDTENQLSWFERNIEVWRQLWRVLEISDVLVIVMDIRHPLLHFPRSLYEYVTKELQRKMIGIFNKTDLVSAFTVYAWRKYFEEQFPELSITCFSCYPRDPNLLDDTKTYALKQKVKRAKQRRYQAQGVKDLLQACQHLHIEKNGLFIDWASLIQQYDQPKEDLMYRGADEDSESDTGSMDGLDDEFSRVLSISDDKVKPHQEYITLGLVGHPNVGKSSIVNSIVQRTVVSTSKTPGHTKHFQTIHLSKTVRLCDSPGLVFPTRLPRALQILSGMYPVAQVQEPYSTIQYLAERVPLEHILSLVPPDLQDAATFQWSAWGICEAFAEKRGFFTARAARPDVSRAANALLRLANDGRILLSFKPPGFFTTTKYEKLRVEDADKGMSIV